MSTIIEGHGFEQLSCWEMVLLRRCTRDVIELGVVKPIYRNRGGSETEVCIRELFEEYFCDENGVMVETVDMVPVGVVLNVPIGPWHPLKVSDSETVFWRERWKV